MAAQVNTPPLLGPIQSTGSSPGSPKNTEVLMPPRDVVHCILSKYGVSQPPDLMLPAASLAGNLNSRAGSPAASPDSGIFKRRTTETSTSLPLPKSSSGSPARIPSVGRPRGESPARSPSMAKASADSPIRTTRIATPSSKAELRAPSLVSSDGHCRPTCDAVPISSGMSADLSSGAVSRLSRQRSLERGVGKNEERGVEQVDITVKVEEDDGRENAEDRNGVEGGTERVQVAIRVRPATGEETMLNEGQPVVDVDMLKGMVYLHRKGGVIEVTEFQYDAVLPPGCTQPDVYEVVARPIVQDVLNGYNGTIMAYGQTGAGKTHTLSNVSSDQLGMIPRAAAEVFVTASADTAHEYKVKMSYIQIYMEMIQDLLRPSSSNMIIREGDNGVFIEGVEEVQVTDLDECLKLLHLGERNRTFAFTKMNAHSSRSHAIVMITVEKKEVKQTGMEAPRPEPRRPGQPLQEPIRTERKLVGKLFLVDLAGSERLKKSGSEGIRASEAKSVNLSLTVLGKCIYARADPASTHIPFRDSKLTRLLQESLGGNAKTSLVICVGPCVDHVAESLSSLQFGQRAMKVKTKAVVNEQLEYSILNRNLQEALDAHEDRMHNLEAVVFTQEEQLEQAKASLALQTGQVAKIKEEREKDATRHRQQMQTLEKKHQERCHELEAESKKRIEEADTHRRLNLAEAKDEMEQLRAHHAKVAQALQDEVQSLLVQRDGLVDSLGKTRHSLTQNQRQLEELQRTVEVEKQAETDAAKQKVQEDHAARRIQRAVRKRRLARLLDQLTEGRKKIAEREATIACVESQKVDLQHVAAAAGKKLMADAILQIDDAMNALCRRFLESKGAARARAHTA